MSVERERDGRERRSDQNSRMLDGGRVTVEDGGGRWRWKMAVEEDGGRGQLDARHFIRYIR